MKSRKPKVVQLSSVHPSFDTRVFHKISKSLAKRGYHVDLIIQHEKDETVDSVHIKALPLTKVKGDRFIKVLPKLFWKCLKYPRSTIFHFHDPEILPIGFILKIFGYKIVYDVHEDVPSDISGKDWIPGFLRIPLAKIVSGMERLATAFFDAVIVVDHHVHSRLGSPKTVMVQNFPILKRVKNSEFKYNPSGKLFYVGDITKIRGAREMVEAAGRIQQTKELEFILAGKFSPPALQDELKELEGWKHTNFVGWISREELSEYMSDAVLGFMLLYPLPHHVGSQPNKLFEYMSGGIPVVSANLPRYSEIINKHECGLLVDPENVDEVVEAIQWILKHPEEAEQMGHRGKEAVFKHYNWENEEQILYSLYDRLLEGPDQEQGPESASVS